MLKISGALLACALILSSLLFPHESAGARLDVAAIEHATGLKGEYRSDEDVYRVKAPRTDLEVSSEGVKITPALGLSSWASFKKSGTEAVMMGDLALTESQVDRVMRAALDSGIEVTALHSHFLNESPRIKFMHIAGQGREDKLAASLDKVLKAVAEPQTSEAASTAVSIDPSASDIDTTIIEKTTGQKGSLEKGVYKITIGRTTMMEGIKAGATMGVNTWAAFAGTNANAVMDGDFAVYGRELQGVLKALTGSGISVTAIHNHMVGEEPRIIFLHFWERGPVDKLATGFKAALDSQKEN